jgi:voltage-gated potassium channel Kch
MSSDSTADPLTLSGHAIIAGYGVPGRAVAEWLNAHHTPVVIIEQNPQIVQRCERSGTTMIAGDVRDELTLRHAGIERASMIALAVPSEKVVLEAVTLARRLNPTIRIIARCTFISGGLEAARRGATQTIVAEEIAAREFVRLLDGGQAPIHSTLPGSPRAF